MSVGIKVWAFRFATVCVCVFFFFWEGMGGLVYGRLWGALHMNGRFRNARNPRRDHKFVNPQYRFC